ncbi:transcription factor bHLH25-like [Abrus precatorius]|uniref:Transcription factor bHLH25-like n=1 Tax=Abrus precatorius TaxID=3816 RepID=A0A8B8K1T8_ABRPR|nr:transcription factor bHLH25-like [Abrus precatorius]
MQYNNVFATTNSSLSSEDASYDEKHGKSNSSNSIISQDVASHKHSAPSLSTFILSFENSSVEPALQDRPNNSPKHFGGDATCSSIMSSKRTLGNHITKPKVKQGNKKFRSSSEIQDHILAERKRRQELTERFIALSATIPGLKKTDKAYILREAINYMKQLQERVEELENQNKRRRTDSVICIKKSKVSAKEESTSCERNFDSGYRSPTPLPQVEARVLEKEVLIGIHCEKQKDIVLKIMALLQNLHLSLASSSVLPFGTSTLKVTIIAQMDDKYCLTVNDLVKSLRKDLLKSHGIQK